MKGLKIIPVFLLLIGLTYIGMLFIEANRDEVIIRLGGWESPPTAQGFVVLTSALVGMVVAGALSLIELFALYWKNQHLKKELLRLRMKDKNSDPNDRDTTVAETIAKTTTGRFS